jgi:hypothetical protein
MPAPTPCLDIEYACADCPVGRRIVGHDAERECGRCLRCQGLSMTEDKAIGDERVGEEGTETRVDEDCAV